MCWGSLDMHLLWGDKPAELEQAGVGLWGKGALVRLAWVGSVNSTWGSDKAMACWDRLGYAGLGSSVDTERLL